MGSIRSANDDHDEGGHLLIVGTFNTPELFLLNFNIEKRSLTIAKRWEAIGNHSWLALDKEKKLLLATCWTDPPCIASYRLNEIETQKPQAELISTQTVKSRSGYVAVHHHLKGGRGKAYTAGGPSGEVLALNGETGKLTDTLQEMNFITGETILTEQGQRIRGVIDDKSTTTQNESHQNGKGSENVLDFGGLRHGAHSVDLSPDAKLMYVADIGRNCVWVHKLDEEGLIVTTQKIISPRSNDGPRHVWPHPGGKYVYVLQEHSSMVDVFEVNSMQGTLEWVQGVRIIPEEQDEKLFWADEVRTIPDSSGVGNLLVASTRGLEKGTKGYVALFKLTSEGLIEAKEKEDKHAWLDIWQTPTSGGWANAIEPCYKVLHSSQPSFINHSRTNQGQYMALTDSEEGFVMILSIETDTVKQTKHIVEIARVCLGKDEDDKVRGAATAVWL